MSVAQRRFFAEVSALLDRNVTIFTSDGKNFFGTVVGLHPETFSICLTNVKDQEGREIHRVFLNGTVITQILTAEKPFDLRALSERLEKVFPRMVRLYEDQGFIWVMDKIKVTEDGVVEGTGPAAERAQRVYEHFVRERKD